MQLRVRGAGVPDLETRIRMQGSGCDMGLINFKVLAHFMSVLVPSRN